MMVMVINAESFRVRVVRRQAVFQEVGRSCIWNE
jgi:hypothetical protein